MEPVPRLDASPPSGLRLVGFLVAVAGALLAGLGAIQTWVTFGVRGLETAVKGTDAWDGTIVLVCAVVMLVGVLATRLVGSARGRKVAAAAALIAGLVTIAVGGAFSVTGSSRFDPVDSEKVVKAIVEIRGVTVEEAQALLEQNIEDLGGFTDIGTGPMLALLGGVLAFAGGLLTLAWSSRIETLPVEPAPA